MRVPCSVPRMLRERTHRRLTGRDGNVQFNKRTREVKHMGEGVEDAEAAVIVLAEEVADDGL